MNFRFSILISLFMHIFVMCLLVIVNWNDIQVAVKQGINSISANNDTGNVKDHEYSRTIRIVTSQENINVLISSFGRHLVYTKKPQKKNEKQQKNRDQSYIEKNRGALVKKASLLSSNYPPEYPYLARRFGYEGRVVLYIEILPVGKAGKISVYKSSGYGMLDRAAVSAVKSWRFFDRGTMVLASSVYIKHGFTFQMKK